MFKIWNQKEVIIYCPPMRRKNKTIYKFTFIVKQACQLTTLTYFQFHNVQVPTTFFTTTQSASSCGCINGASCKRADMTSILYQNSRISEQWNFSNPQQPLIFPNATFCLGFFEFTKTTTCPILNYNPPNNSQHQHYQL